jgi:hypothetical protein
MTYRLIVNFILRYDLLLETILLYLEHVIYMNLLILIISDS